MGNNAAGYEELLIVMEWCPAGVPDLLQDRGGVLNRADTIKVFYQVAGFLYNSSSSNIFNIEYKWKL